MRYAPGIQSVKNKTVRYVYVDTWARNKRVTIWYSRYQPLTGLAWHTVFKPLRSDMRYAPGIQSVENKTVRYVYVDTWARNKQVTVWYSRYQPLTGLAWYTVFKSLRSDMRYAPGIQSVENKTVRYVYSSFLAKHRPERYQSWSITETQGQN